MCFRFNAYVELEAVGAQIVARRRQQAAWDQTWGAEMESTLRDFYDQNIRNNKLRGSKADRFGLEVLWHAIFITLLVDINRLELAVGREGRDESSRQRSYADKWASSADCQRCAIHGALILRKLGSMSLNAEPPVHVPRVLYSAALIWYSYCVFGDGSDNGTFQSFPELSQLGISGQTFLAEVNGYQVGRPRATQSTTLSGMVDLLFCMGHWGLSKALAEQISFLVRAVATAS